ncbi:hypothetical protein F53441_868 [Fusarium austroafricanum]|uniref:FAD-binding PCMH-type domain-containing protein n=1 Tax=Fusarium austroafricanum TaxID=2364996 RepID=A0A8H4P2U3_9HYPO|nr:hypothetical protein F53441_868 [Fusarium austroafricanum]
MCKTRDSIMPNTKAYNATISSYWSKQESALHPECILQPTTAEDVSSALSIISKDKNCRFAIKGHGHAPAAGFANTDVGVTIDMTTLSSVSLHQGSKVASIGAGAKWLDVYKHLESSGVQVAGGRNGNVGVGGLLLGGGISHFTTKVGWACDRVVNYQVVLANGTLINANKDQNPDLFLALKGGGNNFGVVTRFDLQTVPSHRPSLQLDIQSVVFDSFSSVYKADSQASDIQGLSTIHHTKLTNSITSLANFADEKDTPPLNWLFATVTLRPSAQNMQEMFETLNNTIYSFNPEGRVTWSIAFEPLVAAMVKGPRHANVLGLESADDGFIVLISALWPNSAVNPGVEAKARSVLSQLEDNARAKGLLQEFQYLNYAAPYQTPFKSYGKEKLEFLKSVSRKYDRAQILQKRVGGFKL